MAETTDRLRLHRPTGGDPAGVPDDLERLTRQLDETLLGYDQGPLSSRPTAGVEGRMYYALDQAALYYDTGDTWVVNGYQPGDVRWTGRNGELPGWLPCDGTTRSRAAFPALFAAIGITFGRDVGPTDFRLPNLKDRFPIGSSDAKQVGAPGGTDRHTHTLPAHVHTFGGGLGIGQDLSHTVTFGPWGGPAQQAFLYVAGGPVGPLYNVDAGGAGHTGETTVLPPFLALGAWIKT